MKVNATGTHTLFKLETAFKWSNCKQLQYKL